VLAALVGMHLSDKKKNDKDVDYYDNNDDGGPVPQEREESKNYDHNDKPLANLLVVDDDSDIAHVLKRGLLKNRFLVSAFTSPEEALQNFQSNSQDYCLVLSDIRMPGLSGIQLARKVKEINPNVKVILMTSFEIRDSEFSKVFPSTHVDGFVQKPVRIGDLTNKILSIIGETKRLRRQENKEAR
jgi:DNA-binding NtrC family response regulator